MRSGALEKYVTAPHAPIGEVFNQLLFQACTTISAQAKTYPKAARYLPESLLLSIERGSSGQGLSELERVYLVILEEDAAKWSLGLDLEAPGALEEFIECKFQGLADMLREGAAR